MEWIDLPVVIKINMLRYWNKLIDLSNEKLKKKYYNFSKKNWNYEIMLIAEEINQLEILFN